MKKSIKLGFGALVIAMLFLFIGFQVGRLSTADRSYGLVGSDEQPLVGKWRMSVDGEDESWIVEFRPDRTIIRYNIHGQPDIIANWGIAAGELSIQNARNGDPGGYMPPTIMSVANLDGPKIDLSSKDNATHWVLEKTL